MTTLQLLEMQQAFIFSNTSLRGLGAEEGTSRATTKVTESSWKPFSFHATSPQASGIKEEGATNDSLLDSESMSPNPCQTDSVLIWKVPARKPREIPKIKKKDPLPTTPVSKVRIEGSLLPHPNTCRESFQRIPFFLYLSLNRSTCFAIELFSTN